MKPLIMLTAVSAATATAAAVAAKPVRAYAWFSPTHINITKNALTLLKKERKKPIAEFYERFAQRLFKGCTDPDNISDMDKGAGAHYYSCSDANGKKLGAVGGYYKNRLGSFAKSARTSLEENYTSALGLYKSNKFEDAEEVFGRALHFAEDICCPVHTANMKYFKDPKNVHYSFEKFSDTVSEHAADNTCLSDDISFDGSFEDTLNGLCTLSNSFAQALRSLDKRDFKRAADNMIPTAVQAAAAMMICFYHDCANKTEGYLLSGEKYSITDTVYGKPLMGHDSYTVRLYADGTFSLKADDSDEYLLSDLTFSKKASKRKRFRAACKDGCIFRIMAEHTRFEQAAAARRSSAAVIKPFDPADKEQFWKIQKIK